MGGLCFVVEGVRDLVEGGLDDEEIWSY